MWTVAVARLTSYLEEEYYRAWDLNFNQAKWWMVGMVFIYKMVT